MEISRIHVRRDGADTNIEIIPHEVCIVVYIFVSEYAGTVTNFM